MNELRIGQGAHSARGQADTIAVGIEKLVATGKAPDCRVTIEPRRHENQHADLRLLVGDRAWLHSPASEKMLTNIAEHPATATVKKHKSAILIRFDDAILAKLERRMAGGDPIGMDATDMLCGHRFRVSFVNPNTNKALHVGHLRNIVYGHALCSMLSFAGASIERSCIAGDIGRRVCEAMAGYQAYHKGETPQTAGLPGDRFVELCCRDYEGAASFAEEAGPAADPNVEERNRRGDLADRIMAGWLQGIASERALWRRMRTWALSGHNQTLTRLGVLIDQYNFESQEIDRSEEMIVSGLRRGVLERDETGSIIYRTGRPEYATMVVMRDDGALTEFGRCIGVYDRIFAQLDPAVVFIEILGIEWKSAGAALGEMVGRLMGRSSDPVQWAFHGSVTINGHKVGSRTGQVFWVDDLLDAVAAGPAVAHLHKVAEERVARDELADLIVKGTFLCSPTAQPLPFSHERLVEGRASPGYTIASAWSRVHCPQAQCGRVPMARTALVQSQLYRTVMLRAVAERDTAKLAGYLLGLAEACLAAPAVGPAVQHSLQRVLETLGFLVAAN